MPTRVFRRTPESERAAMYGYKDLLKDSISLLKEKATANVERFLAGEVGSEELMEMGLAGVGGVMEFSKAPKAVQGLMKLFKKQGLKYDAFTEPLPGMGYHQWTLYGEGPAKGATFGTKTTELGEMEGKIADLMRKFQK
jgi:hypothetical protein